jgi:hypothetical protein
LGCEGLPDGRSRMAEGRQSSLEPRVPGTLSDRELGGRRLGPEAAGVLAAL